MDEPVLLFMAVVVSLAASFCGGWAASATEIGRECERLGAFYVGEKVYVCKKKDGATS